MPQTSCICTLKKPRPKFRMNPHCRGNHSVTDFLHTNSIDRNSSHDLSYCLFRGHRARRNITRELVGFSLMNLSVLSGSSLFSKPRRTRRRTKHALVKILENPRRPHPPTHAHGHHAVASPATLQL